MISIADKKTCCGCGACANICPQECITMSRDDEGFMYPVIDIDKCVKCGICEKVCPFIKKDVSKRERPLEAWGAQATDDKLRLESSSGGIFSLLARQTIAAGGIVFGVAMSDDCRRAVYAKAETEDALAKFRGSKYLQCDADYCYKDVLNELNTGRKVLFSGTPCQVSGLKSFLGKDYENLLCVDVICHGTPSQALWEKYVDYVEYKLGGHLAGVNFRYKKNGWKRLGMNDAGSTDEVLYSSLGKDSYLQMFLQDFCLRPSCYDCRVKENVDGADVTIADLWGAGHLTPDLNDELGTSLVLVRTEKGRIVFNAIGSLIMKRAVRYEDAIECNPAEYRSALKPNERDYFFSDMKKLSYEELAHKYRRKVSLKVCVRNAIKGMLSCLGLLDFVLRIKHGPISSRGGQFEYGIFFRVNHSPQKDIKPIEDGILHSELKD